jgi:hypothetical protein
MTANMNCGGKNSPHTTSAKIAPSNNMIIFGRRIFGLSSMGCEANKRHAVLRHAPFLLQITYPTTDKDGITL